MQKKFSSSSEHLHHSKNSYDWLGNGIYFWENNPQRALQYAQHIKKNPSRGVAKINNPAVIGAIIDLGNCLNLLETGSLEALKVSYSFLLDYHKQSGLPLPENKNPLGHGEDILLRHLDCAVVEFSHALNERTGVRPFDSVRDVFWEGKELYPNAGFRERNHIQICVRNRNCIKGYFHPRKAIPSLPIP